MKRSLEDDWNLTFPEKIDVPAKQGLKIVTWNVASMKASVQKGFLKYLEQEDPDMIMVQETKFNKGSKDTDKILGQLKQTQYKYQYYSYSTAKKGYAGTALLSKTKPLKVEYDILGDKEGRFIVAEFQGFYLIASYVMNASEGLKRLDEKRAFHQKLHQYFDELQQKKPIIWGGDLNVAHKEVDLKNPKTNTKSPGFTPEEREDFTNTLEQLNLVDIWRHLHPETTGREGYTYFSYRFQCRKNGTGWRLDYFVISQALVPLVKTCDIRSQVYGASDHVPLVLEVDVSLI
ncbi:Endonuclease/exonuclease/phosphatase [Gorgonomyces haynaldii]|nr:Endonuclease/exonuclease/phosphatase [Gorgonomyces haynaldii]